MFHLGTKVGGNFLRALLYYSASSNWVANDFELDMEWTTCNHWRTGCENSKSSHSADLHICTFLASVLGPSNHYPTEEKRNIRPYQVQIFTCCICAMCFQELKVSQTTWLKARALPWFPCSNPRFLGPSMVLSATSRWSQLRPKSCLSEIRSKMRQLLSCASWVRQNLVPTGWNP